MQSHHSIFTAYIRENEIWYEGKVHAVYEIFFVQSEIVKKSRGEDLWVRINDKVNKSSANR
jgi:cytochrome b involved in lipid metabolism